MLQTGKAQMGRTSKQHSPRRTSRNPETIVVAQSSALPDFSGLTDIPSLKHQAPEVLAHWLKQATTEFKNLRDDPSSDNDAFNAAGGTMDAIYRALISHKANRPSVVALQLEAVAAQASLHARKGEMPQLDQTIDFADFQGLVEQLVATTSTIA